MNEKSKFIALKNYIPVGLPTLDDFIIKEKEINFSDEQNVLVENIWISVDPYMRARMTEKKNYKDPFEIGEPMEGAAIGIVKETNSSKLNVGDHVLNNCGWRDKFTDSDKNLKKISNSNFPLQSFLGPLGMNGHTAYIGLYKIGKLQKNQTVLVSSAGGSVGSLVCQIEKLNGCKVVASTGSDEKGIEKHGMPKSFVSIGLGCDVKYAKDLIYSEGMDIENKKLQTPIGVSCRICPRIECQQRAFPPIDKELKLNVNFRGTSPYVTL